MTFSAATAGISETRVIAKKYRLDTLLGEGGMGTVWRAFNLQLEAPVAIKLLRSDLDSSELGERLRVEARAAAKLVHPNIVRVFDVGESETGEPFIVMELLDGEGLREIMDRGPLPAVSAVQLLLPVAEALSLAHSRGVVHRDIKPDNVFIANVGDTLQPKLLDFGIAKVTSSTAVRGASLTSTGTVLGSPEYMSPEQALGRADIDHRSDVWSFCVVLYEALTGRTPFAGDTPQVVLRSVVQDPLVSPAESLGMEPGLSAILERGLSKERERRQQSMFELGQELATWLYVHGALEDAAGAGLEYKWLGRANDAVAITKVQGNSSPRARHDEATLLSVLHPSPLPSARATIPVPRQRRRHSGWVASAAIVGVAFWGCAAWAVFHENAAAGATELRSEQVAETPAPAPAISLAATPPAPPVSDVAIQASIEPTQVAGTVVTKPKAQAAPVARGSLPRALPTAPPRRDLLNPY